MRLALLSLALMAILTLASLLGARAAAEPAGSQLTFLPLVTTFWPNSPWFQQLGPVENISNNSLHWLQGSITSEDGNAVNGIRVQICRADNENICTGPTAPSRQEHNGIIGYYDHIGFTGQGGDAADGQYFAFVAACGEPPPCDGTLGACPRCTEHSPRVYFTIDFPAQAIADVDWRLKYWGP